MESSVAAVHTLVSALDPVDGLERDHRDQTLRWLERTDDVYRRIPPAVPPRHLVSYVALVGAGSVLLVEHRKAGLWLPPGGHVDPGEHPRTTALREAGEELGIEVQLPSATTAATGAPTDSGARAVLANGGAPVFITATRTLGPDQHTDISLWFTVTASPGLHLTPDHREFARARWWTRAEVTATGPGRFDPHLSRFLSKLSR